MSETEQDVANMPAGDELDAISAREVMGAERVSDGFGFTLYKGIGRGLAVGVWRPSSDIACAFMLVDKMRERGFDFWLWVHTDPACQWTAEFSITTVPYHREWEATAEGSALAITRAAVRAIMAETNSTSQS